MQTTVDARGLDCPTPLIKTKKALDAIEKGNVLTIVDNDVAKNNITKLIKSMHYEYNVVEENGEYYIDINKSMTNTDVEIMIEEPISMYDTVILVGSNKFGDGDPDLGDILIKGYFYALSEMDTYPKTIIFLNSGVLLTSEGSKVVKELRLMESKGVEVLSCGTCIDFYGLKDKLAVGDISNMYTIAELMNNCKKVIKL